MEYFDPKTTKYAYPEYTDGHYLEVKKDDGTVFDENYPYVDKSKGFKFKQFWTRVLIVLIVFPMTKIRLGLKITGRQNIKKNKEALSHGAITIANHVHMWDYLSVMMATRYRWPYLLSWMKNVSGESGPLVRMVGGIPIPENNLKATMKFVNAVDGVLKEGKFVHIYPEGSMWEYYAPIRPFKNGAFYFAVSNHVPVIPMGFSYRKPGWIRRKIFKQIALFNLNIGEPLFVNASLDKKEQELDLIKRAHEAICELAHIEKGKNIYSPIYNKSKKIDY